MKRLLQTPWFGHPLWALALPPVALAVLAAVWGAPLNGALIALIGAVLLAVVLVAVHHAEIIALRVGEPFGTLVLALAITVIEVSLIVALMLSGGPQTSALARDTVFATVMIICNGVVGLCLLLGAVRHHVLAFRVEGTSPALSVLATLATVVLVLPTYTTTTVGPTLAPSQLVLVGVVSLALYGTFVFVQTVRHRDYFLPEEGHDHSHAEPSGTAVAWSSLGLLLASLVAVVGLAKALSPAIEQAVAQSGVPQAVVGIAIALMVLLPETWAAVRSAMRNRMQTSFNLALGSALATIGLTIPVVAATSLVLGLPLALGLPAKETALLALTLFITAMTVARGMATVLQGAVHLVLFAVYLFLAVVP